MTLHLAQVNLARMRAPPGDPLMAGLIDRIDEMNRLAEASPGYVWRLPGSQATHEALPVFERCFVPFAPELIFYNLSVWESEEDLSRYVFQSPHAAMLRGKESWLEPSDRVHLALWWIPAGQQPTVAESAERLLSVEELGPTPLAFTFTPAPRAPPPRAHPSAGSAGPGT